MKSTTLALVSALLSTGALAVPTVGQKHAHAHARLHHKRSDDIVWVTEWEVETVTVVETVYGGGMYASRSGVTTTPSATPASTTVISTTVVPTTVVPTTVISSTVISTTKPATSSSAVVVTSASSPPPPPPPTSTLVSPTTPAPAPPPAPTTPSAAAPSVITSAYVAPAPAAPASSAAAPATGPSIGAGSTSPGATYSGEFTHWEPALGACGVTNTEGEAVVAISQKLFDPSTPNGNPNNNPLCGRTLSLIGKDGSTYSAKVVDRCVSCAQGDLDLTLSLFNKVTSSGDGRVANMKWSWT